MANQKITDLTALVGADVTTTDVLPIVDVSADETKKITTLNLSIGMNASRFLGNWNATTNSPTLVSSTGNEGDTYLVSVGGSTNLDGISTWVAGDYCFFQGGAWQREVGLTGLESLFLQLGASAGGDLTGTYPNPTIAAAAVTAPKLAAGVYRVGCVFDGDGSAVAVGSSAPFVARAAGTIIAVYVLGDISTTAVIDIWKTNAAIPTVTNTITASAKPTLTAASYLNDTTFTSWTTSVSANDVFRVHVDSNNNATQLTVIIVIG